MRTPILALLAVILVALAATAAVLAAGRSGSSSGKTAGVRGQIYTSGGCPVVKIGKKCPSAKPLRKSMKIEILTAPASRASNSNERLVKTIRSASDGSFSTTVAAGRYLLKGDPSTGPGTAFTPVEITVRPGVTKVVDLTVDSGIR